MNILVYSFKNNVISSRITLKKYQSIIDDLVLELLDDPFKQIDDISFLLFSVFPALMDAIAHEIVHPFYGVEDLLLGLLTLVLFVG